MFSFQAQLPRTIFLGRVNVELNGEFKTLPEHARSIYKALEANTHRGLIKYENLTSSNEEEIAAALFLCILRELSDDNKIVDLAWIHAVRYILPAVSSSWSASLFGFKPSGINVFTRPADIVQTLTLFLSNLEQHIKPDDSELNMLVLMELIKNTLTDQVQAMQELIVTKLNSQTEDNKYFYPAFIATLQEISDKYKHDAKKYAQLKDCALSLGDIVRKATPINAIDTTHMDQMAYEVLSSMQIKLPNNSRFNNLVKLYGLYSMLVSTLQTVELAVLANTIESLDKARVLIEHLPHVTTTIKAHEESSVETKITIIVMDELLRHLENFIQKLCFKRSESAVLHL